MPRILIIEDELPMRTALVDTLRDANSDYRILTASDGLEGLEKAQAERPDLILLDVMMPKLDGLTVCRQIRRHGLKMPVLMLTAKGQIDDKVEGFEAGADDYLVKPFNRRELLARVGAMLRRVHDQSSTPDKISFGDVKLDFSKTECSVKGRPISLTPKEWAMLRLLAETPGEVITRETFLDRVWGYGSYPVTRTVDNHMLRLRQKLEADPADPKHLLTTNKSGYRLVMN